MRVIALLLIAFPRLAVTCLYLELISQMDSSPRRGTGVFRATLVNRLPSYSNHFFGLEYLTGEVVAGGSFQDPGLISFSE
jgi:hypothetical protein